MPAPFIDIWDISTFDADLLDKLREGTALIEHYHKTERRQFLERNAAPSWQLPPTNPYAGEYRCWKEDFAENLEQRVIRAWHYTRLTDEEVKIIREQGVYPGTLETLRTRLDAAATAGLLTTADADALYATSPCHHREQVPGRIGKFWLTSNPQPIDDSGVELLLGNWGGEATYFWLKDPRLERLVMTIGRPRIIEIAVPIANTSHWLNAGLAVIGTFVRSLGGHTQNGAFDLYSKVALDKSAILAIHSDGEPRFKTIALGYPTGYAPDR